MYVSSYSEDGTTTWCGICILPVSFIVPLREIVNTSQMQYLPNGDPMVNLSQTYKERLLLDLEPQVNPSNKWKYSFFLGFFIICKIQFTCMHFHC